MKNKYKFLVIISILFVVFSALYFLISFKHVSDAAWLLMYLFSALAFSAQIYFYHISFEDDKSLKSKVYGIPVFRVGIIYLVIQLILTLIVTIVNIFINPIVAVVIIAEIVLIGFAAVGLIVAKAYKEQVIEQEEKTIINTVFMDNFKNDIKAFNKQFTYDPLKKLMNDLTELIVYSDPVSNEKLTMIEDEMSEVFILLKDAYFCCNYENLETYLKKLSYLANERNIRCKNSK